MYFFSAKAPGRAQFRRPCKEDLLVLEIQKKRTIRRVILLKVPTEALSRGENARLDGHFWTFQFEKFIM